MMPAANYAVPASNKLKGLFFSGKHQLTICGNLLHDACSNLC